jgi:hypothetical protein
MSMGAEGNGLTLEGLALRLETLERENAALRGQMAELRGSETPRDGDTTASVFEGQVSRRALLSKAGAGAVAAVAAGTLLNTREAQARTDRLDKVRCADLVADTGGVTANHRGSGVGVFGTGVMGVRGHSETAGAAGVHGENTRKTGPGVFGLGVTGVRGHSETAGSAGVHGEHTDKTGPGVFGKGEYGGVFQGSKSQLLLIPDAKPGKPVTTGHQGQGRERYALKGELHLDSAGDLFVCTRGTGARGPSLWRKFTTTAV